MNRLPESVRAAVADRVSAGDERWLRAALCRLLEPDEWTTEADRLVGLCGVVDAFDRLLDPSAAGHIALAALLGPRLPTLDVEGDLQRGRDCGARFVVPGDPDWPDQVDELPRPPYGLWVRGPHPLAQLTARSVAVIGSRASTGYGERVAAELTGGLAIRGWTVVSGGAYGIDAAAHRAALGVPAPTVVVLATGVDVPYPVAHTTLLERIAVSGLVVSEQPPGDTARQLRFLARNRIVAALTKGTVVVEAGLRSGTMTTARQAGSLGRSVMVVPGPVDSWASKGCHHLLRSDPHVRLVGEAAHVVEEVGRLGSDLAPVVRGPARVRDGLKISARRVLDALPKGSWVEAEALVELTGMPAEVVLLVLADLLKSGFVERLGRQVRLAPPEAERARRSLQRAGECDTVKA